jgi:hypothetical protein
MARHFKPIRFFAMMAVAALAAFEATVYFTRRAEHRRTSEERAAYAIGEKTGEEAAPGASLPTAAALNMTAQDQFTKQGTGDPMAWKQGFARGYEEGFKRTHQPR